MIYSWGIFYPFWFITRSIVALLLSRFSTLDAFISCMLNYLSLQFSTYSYIISSVWKWRWVQLTLAPCPFTHRTCAILVYTNWWSNRYTLIWLAKDRVFDHNFWKISEVFQEQAKGTTGMDTASAFSPYAYDFQLPVHRYSLHHPSGCLMSKTKLISPPETYFSQSSLS